MVWASCLWSPCGDKIRVKQPTTRSCTWGKPPHGCSEVSPLCQGREMMPTRMWLTLQLHFNLVVLVHEPLCSYSQFSPLSKTSSPWPGNATRQEKPHRQNKGFSFRLANWTGVFYNLTSSKRHVVEATAWHGTAGRKMPALLLARLSPQINPDILPRGSNGLPRTAEVNDDRVQ